MIKRLVRGRLEGDESQAANRLAAGILKLAKLRLEVRLAGARAREINGIDMVEEPDERLDPFAFSATQLFHLKTEMGPLCIVAFLEGFHKSLPFGSDEVGDFLGRRDGFSRLVLDHLPLGCGEAYLVGQRPQMVDLLDGAGQGIGFGELHFGSVLSQKRQYGHPRPDDHTEGEQEERPPFQRMRVMLKYAAGQAEQDQVA